ncbi:squalene/phytoene synthase family protein, partial [Chondromyces apiculatus]|uniref:Putative geranylgeranyl-diphosphate geranylgeranyltransferase n=1 Tax=Chondromyces apiculatus DSM 436 TaxID=1192034 RepID=A0A017T256_9BACT
MDRGRKAADDVAVLFGSSRFRALADDTLKDEDNAAWVLDLPENARQAWLSRIHWIRLVDRLAENERFEPESRRFRHFLEAWQRLRQGGAVDPSDPFARELTSLRSAWLTPGSEAPGAPASHFAPRVVAAWDAYLKALEDYHTPEMRLQTLREHDTMLYRLSGRIFQLVPFLTDTHWEAAGEFGRLDQFFNNLRDLQEDAEHGICYLPTDVLRRFGVTHEEVLSGRCASGAPYRALMRYWLNEHLPTLRARALPFLEAEGLDPSLQIMRTWSLRRHARIERVLRAVDLDYRRFPSRYWAEVRHDLLVSRARTMTTQF